MPLRAIIKQPTTRIYYTKNGNVVCYALTDAGYPDVLGWAALAEVVREWDARKEKRAWEEAKRPWKAMGFGRKIQVTQHAIRDH